MTVEESSQRSKNISMPIHQKIMAEKNSNLRKKQECKVNFPKIEFSAPQQKIFNHNLNNISMLSAYDTPSSASESQNPGFKGCPPTLQQELVSVLNSSSYIE